MPKIVLHKVGICYFFVLGAHVTREMDWSSHLGRFKFKLFQISERKLNKNKITSYRLIANQPCH